MTDSFKTRIKSMFEKVRKIKHIEIYLTVFVAILIAIIYFSLISSNSAQGDSSTNDDNITQEFSSSMEYVNYLENKLENVLTKVKGAGNVEARRSGFRAGTCPRAGRFADGGVEGGKNSACLGL